MSFPHPLALPRPVRRIAMLGVVAGLAAVLSLAAMFTPPAAEAQEQPNPIGVPGLVQAEAFVDYTDTDADNRGNANLRIGDGVDIWKTSGAPVGYTVGRTRGGERLSWDVAVAARSTLVFAPRVATGSSVAGPITVTVNGTTVVDGITPDANGWWNFQTLPANPITLPAGQHRLTLSFGGAGQVNVDRIDVTPAQTFSCWVESGRVTWSNADAGTYWVYRSTDGGATYSWAGRWKATDPGSNPQLFTDRFPVIGADYQVRRAARTAANCTTVSEPAQTLDLICTDEGDGSLTWNDLGATKYWIYRSDDGGASWYFRGRSFTTDFVDPTADDAAIYQVHFAGFPRTSCRPASPPPPPGADFCPAWPDSDLYRPRANVTTVGPNDDWIGAIFTATPGTEVRLLDGEYYLNRYAIYIETNDITIRGASGDRDAVVIRGMGYGAGSEGLMLAGSGIAVADLTMTGMRDHAIAMKPDNANGQDGIHIYNVHIYDIGTQHIKGSFSNSGNRNGAVACSKLGYTEGGAAGDYNGAIDIHRGVDWVIRDNYIYNLTGDGTGCVVYDSCDSGYISAPAIYLWRDSSGSIIERNVIVESFRNIALGLGSGHDGGIVRNNFIYRSGSGDSGIELWEATNAVVEHNTVILGGGYPGAIEFRNGSGHTIRNNFLSATPWNRGGNSGITIAGNIGNADANDLVAAGDPHLRAGSRAIGAGVPTDVRSDIDGDPRTGSWDVGADQYTR